MEKEIDFLAVGDITIDAFIKLKESAEAKCDIDEKNCKLCLPLGDKVPFEEADVVNAVGNSPNASVSAARLGLSSYLLANVGNDENGKSCIKALEENNVHAEYVGVQEGLPTNYHYVLWLPPERTILVKQVPFTYHIPKDMPVPKWMYLSSMGQSSEAFHAEIADYLKTHPETKLAFQPGTFQMKMGIEKLKEIYTHTTLFFVNVEEAQRILSTTERDIKKLCDMIHALGPKYVVITDGPAGAYGSDGTHTYFMPIYPDPKPPYERTGAGDAFASTFTSAMVLGKSFEEAFTWAPINSMSVVQYVGAQKGLLSKEQLETYLQNAPEDYKLKEI